MMCSSLACSWGLYSFVPGAVKLVAAAAGGGASAVGPPAGVAWRDLGVPPFCSTMNVTHTHGGMGKPVGALTIELRPELPERAGQHPVNNVTADDGRTWRRGDCGPTPPPPESASASVVKLRAGTAAAALAPPALSSTCAAGQSALLLVPLSACCWDCCGGADSGAESATQPAAGGGSGIMDVSAVRPLPPSSSRHVWLSVVHSSASKSAAACWTSTAVSRTARPCGQVQGCHLSKTLRAAGCVHGLCAVAVCCLHAQATAGIDWDAEGLLAYAPAWLHQHLPPP